MKNGGTLEFTYTRPKAALQELRYDLKTSASLSGTWNSAGQAATILSDNETTEQVKATNPAGTPSGSCGCG